MLIRASEDSFRGLKGHRFETGTIRWGHTRGGDPAGVEGKECTPYETVGWLAFGDQNDEGHASAVAAPCFGRVSKLLVANGDFVRPGESLVEFEDRPPTFAEWEKERDRASTAERQIRDLHRVLDAPSRALLTSLKRRYRRTVKRT